MEKAVTEALIEKTACRDFGDAFDVMPGRREGIDIVNPDPLDPFDYQHRTCRVFQIDPWDMDAVIIRHIVGKLASRCRLKAKIEFDI